MYKNEHVRNHSNFYPRFLVNLHCAMLNMAGFTMRMIKSFSDEICNCFCSLISPIRLST